MNEKLVESFVMEVYKFLMLRLTESYGATCFLPVKYTREFRAWLPLVEPGAIIPSLFNKEDIKKICEDIPESEYGIYSKLKYMFVIQFCWKSPEKKEGFFKLRPSYTDDMLKTNPCPMVLTEPITEKDLTNIPKIGTSLIHIMRTM